MARLSTLDAAFLAAEDADSHASLAIGSVTVIDGPAPAQSDLMAAIRERLATVPRVAQKVHTTPLDLEQPAWVDDPDFDLGYHLRRTALPAPGDDAALCRLVSRVMSTHLDRERPLWECWVVEGLAGGRWAVLMKVHHCMADGVSGVRLYDLVTDAPPVSNSLAARPPQPPPAGDGLWLTWPLRLTRSAVGVLGGIERLAADLLSPAKPTSLSGPIGRARRYDIARASLADVREIGAVFGVTVNDVALAAITGAYRAVLVSRGERPWPDAVRTLVPVSTRTAGTEHLIDNRLSAMLAFLPVDIVDPVLRLHEVHDRLAALKSSHEAAAGQSALLLGEYLPFAPIAWLIRVLARYPQRSVITVTTNVPGPDRQMSVLGRNIVEIWPIVPIAIQLRTGIAIMSYAGKLTFGITSDYRSALDMAMLGREIERGVGELLEAARGRGAHSPAARVQQG